MIRKSVLDDMDTDAALQALLSLSERKAISQTDLAEGVKHIMRRAAFSVFQLQRLQSGLDMPDVMPSSIELVIKDRSLNQAIKNLKELHQ